MSAGSAAIAGVPICREPESTRFSLMRIAVNILYPHYLKQGLKCLLPIPVYVSYQQKTFIARPSL